MRNLVIIPTYNELDNIRPMIDKVFSLPEKFDLLVIDDGSPDGTAEIVRERQKAYPESLHLIERQGKLGLGTAYLTGFRWALEHGYDYVFEMDCDFSHNPDDLIRLSAAAAERMQNWKPNACTPAIPRKTAAPAQYPLYKAPLIVSTPPKRWRNCLTCPWNRCTPVSPTPPVMQ